MHTLNSQNKSKLNILIDNKVSTIESTHWSNQWMKGGTLDRYFNESSPAHGKKGLRKGWHQNKQIA